MKRVLFISLVALVALVSCQKEDHAVNQTITYYPEITLTDGNTVAHQVGTPWSDPGVKAVLQGNDVTSQLDIDDQVDPDNSGIYTVKYTFINADGFVRSATRTVVVYDVANANDADITGTYATTTYIRTKPDGSITNYNDAYGFAFEEKITAGPGTGLFFIQDLVCGLYEFYAGYGSAYAYKAFVLLNKDNSFSLLNGDEIDPWGDPIGFFDGGAYYDPESESIVLNWTYPGVSQNKYTTTYADKK